MFIRLNKDMLKILEEVRDAELFIKNRKMAGSDVQELEVSDITELLLCINDEIVDRGMDNQDTVNAFGIDLYRLYDEVLDEKYKNLDK